MNPNAFLPSDEANEKAALGCVILAADEGNAEAARTMLAALSADLFHDLRAREVFLALRDLAKSGGSLDSVSLDTALRSRGTAGKVAAQFAVGLPEATPGVAAFASICPALKEAAWRRQVFDDLDSLKEHLVKGTVGRAEVAFALGEAAEAAKQDAAERNGQLRPGALPESEDVTALLAEALPTPDAIVGGLLRRGEVSVLGGPSKSHKSWASLDLAVNVATGSPWLGRAVTRGRVLLLNLELPRWAIRKRILEIANARRVRLEADSLRIWNLKGRRVTVEDLASHVPAEAKGDLGLIVCDPVYKLLADRDENSASDIADLMHAIESIARETGAHVCCPCHFAKGSASGKESMDRISGSGVFARSPDSVLTLTPHETDGAFVLEAVLRTFPPPTPAVLRWEHPVFLVDPNLDPARLRQPRRPGPESQFPRDKVLGLLPTTGLSRTDWRKLADSELGMSKTTFYRIVPALESSGAIVIKNGLVHRAEEPQAPKPYAD